ncbi:hypothetical protein MCOR02_005540 [Pyricularia oryzae]|nr:hypothetical protein MCOR02_005540 [Pyricularia oryzae]
MFAIQTVCSTYGKRGCPCCLTSFASSSWNKTLYANSKTRLPSGSPRREESITTSRTCGFSLGCNTFQRITSTPKALRPGCRCQAQIQAVGRGVGVRAGCDPWVAAWKDVLRQSSQNDQWRPLAMGHILPSIARYLRRKFEVDPADQAPYMNILNGVLEWSQIISAEALAEVMVAELFPKWHSCLYQWLVSDSVDWIQVVEWFEWWMHSVLPAEIRNCPSIAAEFLKGQRMVDLGLDLGDRIAAELSRPNKDPARKARSDPPSRAQTPLPKQAHHPQAAPAAQPKTEPASFRQQVEDWCAAHDLQFIPERKKVHAKGPLYRITARGDGKGGVLGYFGEDALWFENKGKESIVRGEDDFSSRLCTPDSRAN